MVRAYLGLGSNVGQRFAHLSFAIRELAVLGRLHSRSAILETEPVDCPGGGLFLNACVCLETELYPLRLLQAALQIEKSRGRRRGPRNAPRVLDIDLLMVDQTVLSGPTLSLPHPRMHLRAFVLDPLVGIAPALVHPVLARSVADLRRDLLARSP